MFLLEIETCLAHVWDQLSSSYSRSGYFEFEEPSNVKIVDI